MAVAATSFNWVMVSGGVWTRIAAGPLISGVPIQALELLTTTFPGGAVTYTLDGYSAAPPFYERDGGMVTVPSSSSVPTGHTFDVSIIVSYRSSPYVEFWLLVSRSCWAHISLF